MPKYRVPLYHNVANACVATIETGNADEAGKKAIELWQEDGGAQFAGLIPFLACSRSANSRSN
jgi:hypothetical protein